MTKIKNLLINDNSIDEKIYANFIDHEFSEMPLMPTQWGNYLQKPDSQSDWANKLPGLLQVF